MQEKLTKRELEVLAWIIRNGDDKHRLVDELGITKHTLKAHLATSYLKLHVKNQTDALIKVLRLGLVNLDGEVVDQQQDALLAAQKIRETITVIETLVPKEEARLRELLAMALGIIKEIPYRTLAMNLVMDAMERKVVG